MLKNFYKSNYMQVWNKNVSLWPVMLCCFISVAFNVFWMCLFLWMEWFRRSSCARADWMTPAWTSPSTIPSHRSAVLVCLTVGICLDFLCLIFDIFAIDLRWSQSFLNTYAMFTYVVEVNSNYLFVKKNLKWTYFASIFLKIVFGL